VSASSCGLARAGAARLAPIDEHNLDRGSGGNRDQGAEDAEKRQMLSALSLYAKASRDYRRRRVLGRRHVETLQAY
jgi:hypothetical protein